jgi:predicted PurR-regulated permease PerM
VTDATYARRVAIAVGVLGMAALAWWLSTVILLLFASVILAIFVRTVSEVIEKRAGLGHRLAVAAALMGLTLSILLVFAFFGWRMSAQFAQLTALLPTAFNKFLAWMQQQPLGSQIVGSLRKSGFASALPALSHIPGYALGILGVLADLLLVAAGGVYLSFRPEVYRDGLLKLFPMAQRKLAKDASNEIALNLRKWLLGQLSAMVMVGALVGCAMWAVGVPAAGALGVFAGLAEFIPIAGPIAAAVPALLMSLLIGVDKAGWTLLIFLIIQQVEGNMIIPLIQQKMIQIPPVVTLFALVAFGLLFGPLGIVLATPLTIVASVLLGLYGSDAKEKAG